MVAQDGTDKKAQRMAAKISRQVSHPEPPTGDLRPG